MNKEELSKVINNNYAIIMSLDGLRNVQTIYANRYFEIESEYKRGTIVKIPNHRYPCSILNIFISDETKTVFIALTEVDGDK